MFGSVARIHGRWQAHASRFVAAAAAATAAAAVGVGVALQLFDRWCTDDKNSVLIPGYSVEGTLAKKLLSMPDEVQGMDGRVSGVETVGEEEPQELADRQEVRAESRVSLWSILFPLPLVGASCFIRPFPMSPLSPSLALPLPPPAKIRQRRCEVEYISFSAHVDFVQNKGFIDGVQVSC